MYQPINDNSCGWSHIAGSAPVWPRLEKVVHADWLIIGAGFTGVAAAHRIAHLQPDANVVLLDAERAGNGASSRNSGYIVDVTLNDGGSSLADQQTQLAKSRLNMAGLALLREQVERFDIKCDWDDSGKLHCAADPRNIPKLNNFAAFLDSAGIAHKVWRQSELSERLGTNYYLRAVQTMNGVLVNPAALIHGLLQHLPASVSVYEHSPVMRVVPGDPVRIHTPDGKVSADRVIVAVNALMPRLGYKVGRVFPLTLSASLTRPLSDREYQSIGQPKPWGVLSASSMGATVRLTNDRRLMVRNTAEWWPAMAMKGSALAQRREKNLLGLRKRFPGLTELDFDYSWSGNVCISRNSKPVFEKAQGQLYLVGCYNAGGVAMGSLFGKLIVDYALGRELELLSQVLGQEKPTRVPPRPLLDIGLRTRLAWQRYQGRNEA